MKRINLSTCRWTKGKFIHMFSRGNSLAAQALMGLIHSMNTPYYYCCNIYTN